MEGGCHCGKVRFRVTGEPTWLGRCHCRDCQKISGTAFMTFAGFEKENVEMLGDKPKEYKSSPKVTRTFCEHCGSPVEWRLDSEPLKTNLTLGLFDEPRQFEVQKDLWVEQGVSWRHSQG